MTAEQLHDAIGLLPAELVAEADALRQSRPLRRGHWKRYAAMAACFILVLGCAMTLRLGMTGKMKRSEAVMEAAPAEIPALQTPGAEADSSAVTAAGTVRKPLSTSVAALAPGVCQWAHTVSPFHSPRCSMRSR